MRIAAGCARRVRRSLRPPRATSTRPGTAEHRCGWNDVASGERLDKEEKPHRVELIEDRLCLLLGLKFLALGQPLLNRREDLHRFMFIVFRDDAGQRGGGRSSKVELLVRAPCRGPWPSIVLSFGIDPSPGGFSRDRSKGGCGQN